MRLTRRWVYLLAFETLLLAMPGNGSATDGPIAAYAFDEGSGTTVEDASGHGVTGQMYGTPPTFVPSMPGHGTALSYVGPSVHGGLLIGTPDMWDDVAQGTIEAWVKLDPTTNGYQMWFNARHDVNAGCQYPLELSVWELKFSVFGAYPSVCDNPPTLLASYALTDPGGWHHLAYVVGSSDFAMYVDGSLVAPTFMNGSSSTLYFFDKAGHSSPTVYDIGGADIDSEEWQGLIDDLRVYDRPLVQEEIQTDMATPVAPVPEPALGELAAICALGWIARRRLSHAQWMATGAAIACVAVGAPARAASGPIAAFSFDEGSGTRVVDVSAHGHNGTLYGNPPVWVASQSGHGKALQFDGGATQGGVLLGSVNAFDGVVIGTIEAWVKVDPNASGYHMWFDARDQSGCVHPLELAIETIDGVPYVETWASASGCSATLQSRVELANPDQWHHLAYVVYSSGNVWYVDGVLQSPTYLIGSVATSFFLASAGASPNTVYDIGGADLQAEEFQGTVDDVRIYDRPLSQAEIQADMQTPVDPLPQCSDGIDNDGDGWIDFDGGASVNNGVRIAFPDPQCKTPFGNEGGGACGIGAELAIFLLALRARRRGTVSSAGARAAPGRSGSGGRAG